MLYHFVDQTYGKVIMQASIPIASFRNSNTSTVWNTRESVIFYNLKLHVTMHVF